MPGLMPREHGVKETFSHDDIHIHVPSGAVKKDGTFRWYRYDDSPSLIIAEKAG